MPSTLSPVLPLAALALAACASAPPRPAEPATAASRPAVAQATADRPAAAQATAARAITQVGDPVLRARAAEVPPERIPTPELQALFRRMIAAMRAAPGVGLAAPQIGVPWRVIVLEDPAELAGRLTELERRERERVPFPVRVLVNPVLRAVGEERAVFFEGCLSVSGFVGLVDRAREVEVSGLDERGALQTWRVRGWPARILQHEVDHLDGTLYVDRMMTRSFATAEQARARFAGKPIGEIRRELGL